MTPTKHSYRRIEGMDHEHCPSCGKTDKLNKAGLCNFRWIGGYWVRQRGSEEVAETPLITCDRCRVQFDEWSGLEIDPLTGNVISAGTCNQNRRN